MLELLRIRQLALIEDVEMEFPPGLVAITGETGAGKSFILKALDFLTGDKLTAGMVRPGAAKAVVEAVFSFPGEEYVVRRELSAESGRSRAFVNDDLASADTLKSLRARLLVMASQHGQTRLLQPAFQARLVDGFLDDPELPAKARAALAALAAVRAELSALAKRQEELLKSRELLEHQNALISKVKPQEGEEDELAERKRELAAAAAGAKASGEAVILLEDHQAGILNQLHELARRVKTLADADEAFADFLPAIEEASASLGDLSRLAKKSRFAVHDHELSQVEKRLFELSSLKRSLKRGLPEILALSAEIEANLNFLDACGLDEARLRREEKAKAKTARQILALLREKRQVAATAFGDKLRSALRGLGFNESVDVLFEFSESLAADAEPGGEPLYEHRPRLLWRPNPGQPAQPLDKIASGGELSRFFLAITGLRAEADEATLLFDEVDTGIGGNTLIMVGKRLSELAACRQVLVITHWPQIAALATGHFLVEKEVRDGQTYTSCQRLDAPQRARELARMAGGGELGRQTADQLLLFKS